MANLLSYSTPSIICDVVVVLIVLIFGLIALSKGFFKCLMGFIGTIVAIVLAFTFAKTMSSYFEKWWGWLTKLTQFFTEKFSAINGFDMEITGDLNGDLSSAEVPAFIVSILIKVFSDTEIPEGTTIAQLIASPLANLLIVAASFLIIFILIRLISVILANTVGLALNKMPVISGINKFFGFVLGIIEGLFLVYFILIVLSFIPVQAVTDMIYNSVLTRFLYDYNLFGWLLNFIINESFIKDILKTA